jgi:hypothetical protein
VGPIRLRPRREESEAGRARPERRLGLRLAGLKEAVHEVERKKTRVVLRASAHGLLVELGCGTLGW